MRLDKYLKVSGIIKRRTIAKGFIDRDLVKLNGKLIKAGQEVKVGDKIEIIFGEKVVSIEVVSLTNPPLFKSN